MRELGLLPGRRKSFAKIKALSARCLRWGCSCAVASALCHLWVHPSGHPGTGRGVVGQGLCLLSPSLPSSVHGEFQKGADGQVGPWWHCGIAVVSEEKVKPQKALLDFGEEPQG